MRLINAFLFMLLTFNVLAQTSDFTRQDTLRGSVTPERAWWDLTYYHLSMSVDPDKKYLKGSNLIEYEVLENHQLMQIDLQQPMEITDVYQEGRELVFTREGSAYFIELEKIQTVGSINSILVEYEGEPVESKNPPWSGGLTWQKDSNGLDFIATSCQGDGASLWWPNKDHMYDEVDSMLISVTVPDHLMDVSNGRLRAVDQNTDHTKTFHWFVSNPINNYGVNINIGDYVNFSEVFDGENGPLDCDYYVLRENLDKAKEQFKQAKPMLEAFEHWFGPYPFYEDSYKLVEVPYLGMEHQSSVTYGNDYANGYRGRDLSGSGWGLKFDFIIIHESGHEWFANNITDKDVADMWIHESFTAYSENLYLDFIYGKEASADYVIGTRQNIQNDSPIIGPYGVNKSGSGDMYYKGANMLHTIRNVIDNDAKWRQILRGLNKEFYHQTVTTAQIEDYISEHSGVDLSKVFDQYLRDIRIPRLEYNVNGNQLAFKWANTVDGFDMPIVISVNGQNLRITPTGDNQTKTFDSTISTFSIDRNFYVESRQAGFVKIDEIIENVVYDIRYFSEDNFVGTRVDGYLAPVAYITKEAGAALVKVQDELNKEGLGLKIFDSYRPQKAVDHFVRWGEVAEDTLTKAKYYPDTNKASVFDLGYVAKKSGHTRGSTLDLTIIDLNTKKALDMGSPWDFFGEISHHDSPLVNADHTANRNKLRTVMMKHGFKPYANEWWHYTLKKEPYTDRYFNFNVK